MVVWGPQRNRYKRYLKESPLAIQNWIIGLMLPISSDREESKVLILSSFIVLRYILSCMCFIPRINDQPWRWIKLWITHKSRLISLFVNISSFSLIFCLHIIGVSRILFHKYSIIYKLSLQFFMSSSLYCFQNTQQLFPYLFVTYF